MAFKVSYVEVPVKDIDRATQFYTQLLGVESSGFDDGTRKVAMIRGNEDGGAGMSLNQTANFEPSNQGPLVYLEIDGELDDFLKKAESLGGKTTMPKTAMGEWGFLGIFEDTEGNALGAYMPAHQA